MVDVVEYEPSWPSRFEELRRSYARALNQARAPYLSIEHVGSTAVPGLAAKPVIDIDIVVMAADVAAATSALNRIGFAPRGDLGVVDRYAFVTPERFAPSNTYVVVAGSLALRNHLAVRDTLRTVASLRNEYDAVKRRAAASASDIDEYILMKSEILGRILRRAGLSDTEREIIDDTNRGITGRGAEG